MRSRKNIIRDGVKKNREKVEDWHWPLRTMKRFIENLIAGELLNYWLAMKAVRTIRPIETLTTKLSQVEIVNNFKLSELSTKALVKNVKIVD